MDQEEITKQVRTISCLKIKERIFFYLADRERMREHLDVHLRLAGREEVAGTGSTPNGLLVVAGGAVGRSGRGRVALGLEVHLRLDEEAVHLRRPEIPDPIGHPEELFRAAGHIAAKAHQGCL